MKNATVKLMMAAVALAASAGMASAQTLEANIPFAFRAAGKVFAPGTYRVHLRDSATGKGIIAITGADHETALAVSSPTGAMKKAWGANGDGVLSFRCGESRCAP